MCKSEHVIKDDNCNLEKMFANYANLLFCQAKHARHDEVGI